jgi:hypothetical protein
MRGRQGGGRKEDKKEKERRTKQSLKYSPGHFI